MRKFVAGDQPGLHIRIALPVAPVLHEIRLQRSEAHNQWPAGTERPQACIDSIYEAVLGALIEQPYQQLAETQIVGLRLDIQTGGEFVCCVRIYEHEVDVGGEIQLVAAELAHAEHEQRQLPPRRVARPAEPGLELRRGKTDCGVDQTLCQQRHVGERGFETREPCDVAPCDARHLDLARLSQGGHGLRFGGRLEAEACPDGGGVERLRIAKAFE